MYNMVPIASSDVRYIESLLREQILRVLITRKNCFPFLLYPYENLNISLPYCTEIKLLSSTYTVLNVNFSHQKNGEKISKK